MKALTVWQPWATLIAIGAKPYEFRSWKPPGWMIGKPLAIHAGARPVREAEIRALVRGLRGDHGFTNPCLRPDLALPLLERILPGLKAKGGATLFDEPAPFRLPLSSIVCVVRVGEGKRGDHCAEEFGASAGNDSDRDGTFNWGWPMLDIKPLTPPEEARGAQGLWDWGGRP
jgi:hypothetical protein